MQMVRRPGPMHTSNPLILLTPDLIVIEGLTPYNETEHGLHKRSTIDYSGVNCSSTCDGSPGEGPNEADCVAIIEQKLFRAGEAKFTVQPNSGGQVTYGSCVIALYVPYDLCARHKLIEVLQ